MIIQRVIRDMASISQTQAQTMLDEGILCNLIRNKGPMSLTDIPKVLVDRNTDWHQDHYGDPDPLHTTPPNEIFSLHTPFISTTAGTVERRKTKTSLGPLSTLLCALRQRALSRTAICSIVTCLSLADPQFPSRRFRKNSES